MFKVKKEGRVLMVNETEKAHYLSEGYDVVDLVDGEYVVTEKATGGRTYTVAEYNAVADELEQLKSTAIDVENSEKFQALLTENESLKAELAKAPKEFERQAAMDFLKEKGVEFPGNISNDNLKKLLEENA